MLKKALLSVFLLFPMIYSVSCKEQEFDMPTFSSFTVKTVISGEREFQATITESYSDFTSDSLPFTVRYKNGTVLCEGTEVSVEAKNGSIFKLSETIAEILKGNGENTSVKQKSDRYEIRSVMNGTEFSVWIDKQTMRPTVFFTDEYTVKVIDFQDTTDESHTQNMGDG